MEPESRAATAQTERLPPEPTTLAAGQSPAATVQEAAVSINPLIDPDRRGSGWKAPHSADGLLLDGAEGGERTVATKRENQAPTPLEAMLAAANAAGGLTRVMPTLSSEEYAQRERAYEAMSAGDRSGEEDLGGKV